MREHVNSDSTFRENILSASKNNFSRIVLALDLQGSSQSQLLQTGKKLVEETSPYICAIKIGRQTVLNLGMQKTRILIAASHANELPSIIDDKLGDIDETNSAISQAYFELGFDAIIVNPIAGWKGGLEPVFKLAHNAGSGNRPDIVKKVRAKLHNGIHIYSPGIGTQGGKVLRASKAGSDFFIIGRSITRSSDPERAVHNFARQSVS